MEYKIGICDDSPGDCSYIKALINNWANTSGNQVIISAFPSAEAFLFDYAENTTHDILLLDIEMKAINGIELAKQIRQDNETVQIIFVTGYPDYIAEGYEVSALHYLMKPVGGDRLSEVLNRAVKNLSRQSRRINLTADGQTIRIPEDEIMSIEIFDHLLEIQTTKEHISVKMPISRIENDLSGSFTRCHRGCIVNMRYIRKITKTDVILDSGKTFPLSRRLYGEVNRAMLNYMKGGRPE